MPLPEKPRVREQMKGNAMANPLYDGLFGRHAGKTTPFLYLLDGSTITHQDFLSRAAQIANVMLQLNLKPGDRVAAQIEKSPEALASSEAMVPTTPSWSSVTRILFNVVDPRLVTR